jgi:hypothetical protein
VQGEELNDAIVDFDLQLVDGVFFVKDTLGEGFIGFEHGVNGLMNGALGEAAHPEQPLVSALFRRILTFAFRIPPAPTLRSLSHPRRMASG